MKPVTSRSLTFTIRNHHKMLRFSTVIIKWVGKRCNGLFRYNRKELGEIYAEVSSEKLEQWTCLAQIKCYQDKHFRRTTPYLIIWRIEAPNLWGRVALEVRLISFQESKIELILFRQQLYQKSAVEFTAKISVAIFFRWKLYFISRTLGLKCRTLTMAF